MLTVKTELLQALRQALEHLSPGAGDKCAFESPKVAAHGDLATTAAMQLAKPLKQNPRALAETLRTALLATAAFQAWVEALDVAGPGFINIRLKPSAKQQVVREVLAQADAYGTQASHGRRMLVEFVSANPTGPLHVGHGRQAALGDAICNLFASQGWQVYREFYYNDAGVQIATLATSTQLRAQGFKPGDTCWPTDPDNPLSKNFYNGEYIADIASDFLAGKTVQIQSSHPMPTSDYLPVAIMKLLLHPLLVLAVGTAAIQLGVPLTPFALTVMVLVSALPSASNVSLLAERFGADNGRIARIILVTTAAAFLTFSGAVALMI